MDRNLVHYHAEAIAARWLWGAEYAKQNGGQLDFYEGLSPARKQLCAAMVTEIQGCQRRATQPAREGSDHG